MLSKKEDSLACDYMSPHLCVADFFVGKETCFMFVLCCVETCDCSAVFRVATRIGQTVNALNILAKSEEFPSSEALSVFHTVRFILPVSCSWCVLRDQPWILSHAKASLSRDTWMSSAEPVGSEVLRIKRRR